MKTLRIIIGLLFSLALASPALASGPLPGGYTPIYPYTGPVGLTGNQTNGADQVSHVNLNGSFNIQTYGAKNDNAGEDNAPAINAAITAACSALGGGSSSFTPAVYFPTSANGTSNGFYDTCTPIIVSCNRGVNLIGDGNGSVDIANSSACATPATFPLLWFEPLGYTAGFGTITATSLATGSGAALNFAAAKPHFYNLGQMYVGGNSNWLNGLTHFQIQFFYNFPATGSNSSEYIIMGSQGYRNAVPASQQPSFKISITQGSGTSTMNACVIVSTTGSVCATGSIPNATTQEAEFSYDGAHIRLFTGTPGSTTTLLQSTAAVGTVVQNPEESFVLGEGVGYTTILGDVNNSNENAYIGKVDSIDFENVAGHTSTYTAPTTKFSPSGNTLALINGTGFDDAFLITDKPVTYLPIYDPYSVFVAAPTPSSSLISGLYLFNYNGGDVLQASDLITNGKVENSVLEAVHGMAVRLYNFAYGWRFDNDQFIGDLGGMVVAAGSGSNLVVRDSIFPALGAQQFMWTAVDNSSGTSLINTEFSPVSTTLDGVTVIGGPGGGNWYDTYLFDQVGLDVENGGNATAYTLALGGSFIFNGGVYTNDVPLSGGPTPSPVFDILPDTTTSIIIDGGAFDVATASPATPEIFKFETEFSSYLDSPLRCIGCNVNRTAMSQYTTVPLSTDNTQIDIEDVATIHGSKPTVSTCGTSPSPGAVTGDKTKFKFTVGGASGVTACTLTFPTNDWAATPNCTIQDTTQGIALAQSGASATNLTLGAPSGISALFGDTIQGQCAL